MNISKFFIHIFITGFTNPLLHQGHTSRSHPASPAVFQPNTPTTPLTTPLIMNAPSSEGLSRPSASSNAFNFSPSPQNQAFGLGKHQSKGNFFSKALLSLG